MIDDTSQEVSSFDNDSPFVIEYQSDYCRFGLLVKRGRYSPAMKTILPGMYTFSKLGIYESISGADFMGYRLDFYKQVRACNDDLLLAVLLISQ